MSSYLGQRSKIKAPQPFNRLPIKQRANITENVLEAFMPLITFEVMFLFCLIYMFFNMKKEDLYQEVLGAVCRNTGIDETTMLRSNKEYCVDARYLLIHFLAQKLTDEEIATLTGIYRQSVNHIRNNFPNRLNKWSIKEAFEDISGELA